MWRSSGKTLHGVEVQKIKKNAGVYGVLLVALGAMTFFGVCNPRTNRVGASLSGAAASVGRDDITRMEFQRTYRATYDRYQKMYAEAFDPKAIQLAKMVLKEMVDDRITYQKAQEWGLGASDDEALDILRKEKFFNDDKGQFSEERFSQFLQGQGYTEASFLEEIRRSLVLQRFRRFVTDSSLVSSKVAALDYRLAESKFDLSYLKFDPQKMNVTVNPADIDTFIAGEQAKIRIKDYYEQNIKEYQQPEKVKARHIVIGYKGSRGAGPAAAQRSKEDAQKKAQEILSKAKTSGIDFIALAKEATDEPAGKESGGDLGYIEQGKMDKSIVDAAFALSAGAISDLVESPSGYHIIKSEEKKPALNITLEGAQKKIAEILLAKEKRPAVAKQEAEKALAEIKEGKNIDAMISNLKIQWTDTGEVTLDAKFVPGIGSSQELIDGAVTLTKIGEVYPKAIDVRGSFFLIKLKARKDADMTKFDAAKKRETQMMAAYGDGQSMTQLYEKQARESLEKRGKVWMNPSYLALDQKGPEAENDSGG